LICRKNRGVRAERERLPQKERESVWQEKRKGVRVKMGN
jgi:hypothetical protein